MTRSSRFLFVLVAVAALAVLGCPPKLDHFKAYELVEPQQILGGVELTDQFASEAKSADLHYLTHFATPVAKEHAGRTIGIFHEHHHLSWYQIGQEQGEPRREIQFTNQFGANTVVIGEPRLLLTPARKLSDPDSQPPERLDHYKCYEVLEVGNAPEGVLVNLDDQFGLVTDVFLGPPKFFCPPALKSAPGHANTGSFHNEDKHLVVYELPSVPAAQQDARVKDQFREWPIAWEQAVYLAVPSTKGSVEIVDG